MTKSEQIKELMGQIMRPAATRTDAIVKDKTTFNLEETKELALVNTSCAIILAFDEPLLGALETLEEYNEKHNLTDMGGVIK